MATADADADSDVPCSGELEPGATIILSPMLPFIARDPAPSPRPQPALQTASDEENGDSMELREESEDEDAQYDFDEYRMDDDDASRASIPPTTLEAALARESAALPPEFRAVFTPWDDSGAYVRVRADLGRLHGTTRAALETLELRTACAEADDDPHRECVYMCFDVRGDEFTWGGITFRGLAGALPPTAHEFTREILPGATLPRPHAPPACWAVRDRLRARSGACTLREVCELSALTLHNCAFRCHMCDAPLETAVRRPTVCAAERCVFQAGEIGMGVSLEWELQRRPTELKLLLIFLQAASGSTHASGGQRGRAGAALELCPLPGFRAEKESVSEQCDELVKLLPQLPQVDAMQERMREYGSARFPDWLAQKGPALLPLLQWVIGGCRATLRHLTPEQTVPGLNSIAQFVITQPVERDARFKALKQQHGSFLAFHGSPLSNWHSIVRRGLHNFSLNERFRLHGAAHGSGVYTSPRLSVAAGYARAAAARQEAGLDGVASCVALVEIIKDPAAEHMKEPARRRATDILVVPNEEHVRLAVLLVFRNGDAHSTTGSSNAMATGLNVPAALLA